MWSSAETPTIPAVRANSTQGTMIQPTEIVVHTHTQTLHTACILAHHCAYQNARCVHAWHISLQQEVKTNFPRPTESDNLMIPIVSAPPPSPSPFGSLPPLLVLPSSFLYFIFFVSRFLFASFVFILFLPALFSFILLSLIFLCRLFSSCLPLLVYFPCFENIKIG
jgi:hypothetical protein